MKIITDPRCTEYRKAGHPERPQRILGSVEKLKSQTELEIDWLEPLPVSDEQILRAHTRRHLDSLHEGIDFDPDTPAHLGIDEHARRSVGAALHALKLCREGETAFSLIRPPGHHATKNTPMGFCYLNNIAISVLEARASAATRPAGSSIGPNRVAVFDFDVHHGNGTEDILLDRDDCAFFSVHQWPAYPGSGQNHRGENCFNYPVSPNMPAEAYRAACSMALDELKKFKPDLIAVSAGFDSYKGDFLCEQNMDVADFHWLGKTIRDLKIPTFSLLEGGYSKALPELIFAYLKGLNGL